MNTKQTLNMYIVKREVLATSIANAMRNESRGRVYEVCLAEEKYQPPQHKPLRGFAPTRKNKRKQYVPKKNN